MEINERLANVFRNVFQDDSIEIEPGMTADYIEGWDSLSHVNLIIAVEIEFGIEFSQAEIRTFEDVGALVTAIKSKVG
jgi:acyl carrier protein